MPIRLLRHFRLHQAGGSGTAPPVGLQPAAELAGAWGCGVGRSLVVRGMRWVEDVRDSNHLTMEVEASELLTSSFIPRIRNADVLARDVIDRYDAVERISFPGRREETAIYLRNATEDDLAAIVITDDDGNGEKIIAYLPVPTRVGRSFESPSHALSALCRRYGDSCMLGGERAKVVIRNSTRILHG